MTRWILPSLVLLALACGLASCSGDAPKVDTELSRVITDLTYLKDDQGRYLHLRGSNVGGSTKVPLFLESAGTNGRDFTYIGRPFPLEEADKWFSQLQDFGFNVIRLLWIWESVYPDAKGEPDEEFLDYFDQIIAKAAEYGIYVLINCHENLWSRHLFAYYNEEAPGNKGDLDNWLMSLLPPYTDKVAGDGAPLWATKLCLPEKDFDSPNYGSWNMLGTLAKDEDGIPGPDFFFLARLALPALGFDSPEVDAVLDELEAKVTEIGPFDYTETVNFIPWTFWGLNVALSPDMERCYAAFYAGDKVYPNTMVSEDGELIDYRTLTEEEIADRSGDENIKDYLQESFKDAWVEIAKRAKKHDNVIGYDVQNEPPGLFIILTALSAYFSVGLESAFQTVLQDILPLEIPANLRLPNEPPVDDTMIIACESQCDQQRGLCEAANESATEPADCNAIVSTCEDFCDNLNEIMMGYSGSNTAGNKIYYLLKMLEFIPPDTSDETKKAWGFDGADLFAIAGLNSGFGKNCVQPLYEKVGAAIQQEDPNAIIWFEPAIGIDTALASGNEGAASALGWEKNMTRPAGLNQVVFAPHWYPDIYPEIGINMPSRIFAIDEMKYRDFTGPLRTMAEGAAYSMGNVPVVCGEFGTYWNYRYLESTEPEKEGWEQSRDFNYQISAEILDNYYEGFENLFLSNINWCYTTDNDPEYGDQWNHEDFSIIDEFGEPRGWQAYVRPYPRLLSGKPISMHFYSPLHYFDPQKGVVNPEREFELVFASKEVEAPTIIFVPLMQYTEGFYVWLSDGWATWDQERQWLIYHPQRDEPEWEHKVTIRPPLKGQPTDGYSYFVRPDGGMIAGR